MYNLMKYIRTILILTIIIGINYSVCLFNNGYGFHLGRDNQQASSELDKDYPSVAQNVVFNELVDKADSRHKDAQGKAAHINTLYNRGKQKYLSEDYQESKACFEEILGIDPSYEPALLFLESVVTLAEVSEARSRMESLKMRMLDILAEYDKRVKRTDMLAVRYFLELAQRECQLGNFQGAENYYSLCYKIHPYSKEKIEWFVKATHDLMVLYNRLDEENQEMEELTASLR